MLKCKNCQQYFHFFGDLSPICLNIIMGRVTIKIVIPVPECGRNRSLRKDENFEFWRHKESNSPTFYEHILVQKCFYQAFSTYSMLATFWQKNIVKNAACKMLVKLTPRVNFIHMLVRDMHKETPTFALNFNHII